MSIPRRASWQEEHGACSPVWLVNQRSELLRSGKRSFDGQTLDTDKKLFIFNWMQATGPDAGRSPTTIADS
jgi:hypothetical protein